MRAAAILGLGCSPKQLRPFQDSKNPQGGKIDWQMGLPAARDAADVVVLLGGDGTIHRHLQPLVRLGLPVLIVPAGSGNDFARAIGLRRMRDSLDAWRKFCAVGGNVRAIDLGMISEIDTRPPVRDTACDSRQIFISRPEGAPETGHPCYFCGVAGIGLDAEVARRANRLPRWLRGNGGYVLGLLPTIFRFAPLPMKIFQPAETADPFAVRGGAGTGWTAISDQPTTLAAFANTTSYGGGMKIAPQAKMDDGLLDVCVVGAVDPFKLFCMFPTVYSGRHLQIREVKRFHASRVRVETEHPIDVYADGEFVCRTPVEVQVQPSALKIVIP